MFNSIDPSHRFRIKSVANITGLSTHVLRKWEERYHLLHPQRGSNGYRMFSEDDMQFLLFLKYQLSQGETIGQLAERGEAQLRQAMKDFPYHVSHLPHQFVSEARRVIHSAQNKHDHEIQRIIASWILQLGLEEAMEVILLPLLQLIGELWHQGAISIAGENSVSRVVRQQLIQALREEPTRGSEHVLTACLPNDYHEIVPLMATLLLRKIGWQSTFLGPNVSFDVLQMALRRKQAQLIILSSMIEPPRETIESWIRDITQQIQPYCRLMVGGAGLTSFADLFRAKGISFLSRVQEVKSLQPPTRVFRAIDTNDYLTTRYS